MLSCMEHFYIKYLSDIGMKFTHFPLNSYWLPIVNQNPEQDPESMMNIHLFIFTFHSKRDLFTPWMSLTLNLSFWSVVMWTNCMFVFFPHRFAYKSNKKHNTVLTSEVSYIMLKWKVLGCQHFFIPDFLK